MSYTIQPYSYKKAKELNVHIEPSARKNKKIKVVDKDKNVYHIGDIKYNDYPTYLLKNKKEAEERKRLYHLRHREKTKTGFYARKLLW